LDITKLHKSFNGMEAYNPEVRHPGGQVHTITKSTGYLYEGNKAIISYQLL